MIFKINKEKVKKTAIAVGIAGATIAAGVAGYIVYNKFGHNDDNDDNSENFDGEEPDSLIYFKEKDNYINMKELNTKDMRSQELFVEKSDTGRDEYRKRYHWYSYGEKHMDIETEKSRFGEFLEKFYERVGK